MRCTRCSPRRRPARATVRRGTDAALEALATALDGLLTKGHGEPSAAWTRIVYLVTRAHPQMPTHRADALCERLTHSHTQIRVIGVDLGEAAFWRAWVARVPGALLATPEEAEAHALEPTVQLARSNPIHTTLSFGELDSAASIEIPVQLHKATAQQRPMAPRRMARSDGTTWERQLEGRRAFYRARDVARAGGDVSGLTPLPDDAAHARAYRLGKTLVPVPDAELPLDTRPAIEILHFVHASTYRREYHLGETYYVLPNPRTPRAQIALSSLVQAAAVKGVYALARYVARAHAEPRLCVLAPLIEHEFDGFYMVRVPFRDDVRRWAFPPLDRVVTSTGHTVRTHPTIPTPAQQAQMDALVERMDLMDMDDHGDEEGCVVFAHQDGTRRRSAMRPRSTGRSRPSSTGTCTRQRRSRRSRLASRCSCTHRRAPRRARGLCEMYAAPSLRHTPRLSARRPKQEATRTPRRPRTRRRPSTWACPARRCASRTPRATLRRSSTRPSTSPRRAKACRSSSCAGSIATPRWASSCTRCTRTAPLRARYATPLTSSTSRSRGTRMCRYLRRFVRAFHAKARSRAPDVWRALRGRLDLGLITASEDASHRSTETPEAAAALVAP